MTYHLILIYLVVNILLLVGYTLYLRKTQGEVSLDFILLTLSWPLSIPVIVCFSPLIILVLFFLSVEKIIKRGVSRIELKL